MSAKKPSEIISDKDKYHYINYIKAPLKLVGCWDLFHINNNETRNIINDIYLAIVLFVLIYIPVSLGVYLYTEWKDIMSSLDKIADSLPLLVSVIIVTYFAMYRKELYALVEYMDNNFKYHSARGLTNMSMFNSCKVARRFGRVYTACTMFSVTVYAIVPVIIHLWTKEPLQNWLIMDMTRFPFYEFVILVSFLSQLYVGLAMGQFGVFFASNSILICGQLDVLCCSLRNVRYTALLQNGVKHSSLAAMHAVIQDDERYNYIYNVAEMKDSEYHYDQKVVSNVVGKTYYDINSPVYDAATMNALRDCASFCRMISSYKEKFERFVSPLLVVRVIQVTLYLCTLLYEATLVIFQTAGPILIIFYYLQLSILGVTYAIFYPGIPTETRTMWKLEMVTVEYLAAVALDIFVYCYYGTQIILQADRVSTAAYQCAWHTMGVRPRRVLLNILLANKRPMVVRAGRFLSMDLHTFVVIIKTSFSYYTLLVNVNEK